MKDTQSMTLSVIWSCLVYVFTRLVWFWGTTMSWTQDHPRCTDTNVHNDDQHTGTRSMNKDSSNKRAHIVPQVLTTTYCKTLLITLLHTRHESCIVHEYLPSVVLPTTVKSNVVKVNSSNSRVPQGRRNPCLNERQRGNAIFVYSN